MEGFLGLEVAGVCEYADILGWWVLGEGEGLLTVEGEEAVVWGKECVAVVFLG